MNEEMIKGIEKLIKQQREGNPAALKVLLGGYCEELIAALRKAKEEAEKDRKALEKLTKQRKPSRKRVSKGDYLNEF